MDSFVQVVAIDIRIINFHVIYIRLFCIGALKWDVSGAFIIWVDNEDEVQFLD